jgi:quercetin dioxygenase-like cupin family protein
VSTITTGRTLDADGEPIPGTGFELDTESWLATQIRERSGPISSHPTQPMWSIPVGASETDDETGGGTDTETGGRTATETGGRTNTETGGGIADETVRGVSVVARGYDGPPPHYHTQSRERFDVRRGELTLELDGAERRVPAGETAVVETGVEHTFRVETDDRAVVVTEIDAPGRLRSVLPTLGGLAHDTDRDPDDPLQRAVIADRLADHTVFTAAEGGLVGAATELLAPVGRAAGYQAAYGEYLTPAFWRAHVEQPSL